MAAEPKDLSIYVDPKYNSIFDKEFVTSICVKAAYVLRAIEKMEKRDKHPTRVARAVKGAPITLSELQDSRLAPWTPEKKKHLFNLLNQILYQMDVMAVQTDNKSIIKALSKQDDKFSRNMRVATFITRPKDYLSFHINNPRDTGIVYGPNYIEN